MTTLLPVRTIFQASGTHDSVSDRKHNLDKDKTIMMGDRDIDIQAAWNAGIKGCLLIRTIFIRFRADAALTMSEIAASVNDTNNL